MTMTELRMHQRRVFGLAISAAIVVAGVSVAAAAQTPAISDQTAPQTTLYGVCTYIANGTYYHTEVLSAAMTMTVQIQRQFVQYAAADTAIGVKTRVGCHWALTQREISKGLQLIEQSASTKQGKISWRYNAAALQASPQRAASGGRVAGAGTPAATTGPAVNAAETAIPANTSTTGGSSDTGVVSAPSSGTLNSAAQAGTTSAGSGLSSIGTSTVQTMKDAQTNATSALTTSIASATSSTVNDMTNAATTAVGNMFKKKKKPADGAKIDENGAPGAVLTNSALATPGLQAAPAPAVATATSTGVSFLFCHLQANGSEYYSDIFPAGAEDQSHAAMVFWREVSRQYKIAKITFSNNVSCQRSDSDAEAMAASAARRGVTAGHTVETGWAYMGDVK